MPHRCRARLIPILVSFALLASARLSDPLPAAAQFPPDTLENLQVLPADIEVRQLINTMRGFALGLGVRCQHCHVGEEGQPLAEFDFPSDEKATKRKAREMLRMVMEINDQHLGGLEERGDPPVEVMCVTCHRGQARPVLIEGALKQAVADGGAEAGLAKYGELRERYYGSHTFDFSEFVLVSVAQDLWAAGEREAAVAFGKLNLEYFSESGGTYTLLGQAYAAMGDRERAIMHLEKALEINPRNPMAQRTLDDLKSQN